MLALDDSPIRTNPLLSIRERVVSGALIGAAGAPESGGLGGSVVAESEGESHTAVADGGSAGMPAVGAITDLELGFRVEP